MHYYEHENYNKLVDKCNQVILENSNYIELPPILTRNTIESIIKRAMETIESGVEYMHKNEITVTKQATSGMVKRGRN